MASAPKERLHTHNQSVSSSDSGSKATTTLQAKIAKSIIFVLGGPGSGKGTNCSKICSEFKYTHLCAGDLLRKEAKSGSELGQEIDEIMKRGQLVRSEVTTKLLENEINSTTDSTVFLIDGFPRELGQAKLFEDQVGECQAVLVFECSDEVMTDRMIRRGRPGDNEDTIRRERLKSHATETVPVIKYYREKLGNKVYTIHAEKEENEVYVEVKSAFMQIMQDRARL